MSRDDLIKAGRLSEAITSLNQEVKERPQDLRLRTKLFELLCITGDWQRAERALAVMADQSIEVAEGVTIYRKLLMAENKRRQFLMGGAPPRLPVGDATLTPYLIAIKQIAGGKEAAAAALLEEAAEHLTIATGQRNRTFFVGLRDVDDRFAAVLEVLLGDEYLWLPLSSLLRLQVYPPRHLRDLVFAPAVVDWGPGPQPVFLPVRYPGSEKDARPEVQLARRTTTQEEADALVICLGQRVLLLEDRQVPLLELDSLQMNHTESHAVPI